MKFTWNKSKKFTREEIEHIRDFFLKPGSTEGLDQFMAAKAFPEDMSEPYPGMRQQMVSMVTDHIRENFATIHANAESPIEILFLSTLCMNFMYCNPLYAAFTPPINPDFPDDWRKNHEAALEMWKDFQEGQESDNLLQFIEEFKEMLERQDYSQDYVDSTVGELARHLLHYHLLDMKNSYHFSLQTSLVVNKKTIRPDIYVWVPSQPKFKLIVECDGFEHHTGRAVFSSDRARDRALQIQGFQVFRFSGHEIYHDPVSTSMELFEYLMSMDTWHSEEE